MALLVLTSILIGAGSLLGTGQSFGAAPVILAVLGAAPLAFRALTLSFEMRLSARTTGEEMQFLVGLGQHDAGLYENQAGEPSTTLRP